MSKVEVRAYRRCFGLRHSFGVRRSTFVLRPLLVAFVLLSAFAAADEPYGRHQFNELEREHWAFQPIARPEAPQPRGADWCTNEVDAFILTRLEAEGLAPAPPADPATLLRRVYLDLIGLPPTVAEQDAFLADPSLEAYTRVVDDLLSRPQFGERWGRHWLDVARYAESNGYERDNPKPNAWRYRDWVIAAVNADMPFDEFLIQQLAGDEIEGSDAAAQIATTFLRLGPWDDEPAEPAVDRYDQLDDVLATTSAAFLGLTLRCARCHDHKFEPLRQTDYYRVLAAFEPLERPRNDRDDLDLLVGTVEELAAHAAATAETDARVAEVQVRIDALEQQLAVRMMGAGGAADVPVDALAALARPPAERTDDDRRLLAEHGGKLRELVRAAASDEERGQLASWDESIAAINTGRPTEPPRAYVWRESVSPPPATHVLHRGDPAQPAQEVSCGVPAILVDGPLPPPEPTARTTGRRLQLARWLAQADHPLTARVAVNRLWQHHFGDGIVGTESDFGVMGQPPTHPELLDWLAQDFVAGGWHAKRLHRQIVLSSAYRMSGRYDAAADARDPETDLLWRYPPRRLEAEAIRDSILAASGQLNLQPGGPSVYPAIPPEVLAGQSRPGSGWGSSDASQAARRSVYVFVKRTLLVPELEILDWPSTNETCEQRVVSTVAPQALALLNGAFLHEQSRHFAARLLAEAGDDSATQVVRAFRIALCRPPTDEELQASLAFLAQQEEQILSDQGATDGSPPLSEARTQALASFCRVLLNGNEFVYLR
jgi:hypothetical protein